MASLTDDEINEFWGELDHDKNGQVTFAELERRLELVHDELVPKPRKHNLNHPDRKRPKEITDKSGKKHTHDSDLHDFLCKLMPGCGEAMDKDEFVRRVKSWEIPSPGGGDKTEKQDAQEYERKLPFRRRAKAWWSVKGPQVLFLTFVVALQLAFGLWQFLYYLLDRDIARAALGWGVVCAKLFAGLLYPTVFFMVLSMSRWFATFCRKSYILSRFVDWDYSQKFHIVMACETIFFAIMHTIGHLTGSFVWGSRGSNQGNIAELLGPQAVPMSYSAFIRERPGWTGLTALSCFVLIGITSAPWFRKKSYELFQWFHLLMYPAFAMLAIHGTARILQFPMMGFWLIIPVLLVLVERSTRGYLSFFGHHDARLEALDDGTVVITAEKPDGKVWHAKAGQYVFVQIPQISRFQWHPFTISACIRNRLQVHIKADGDWTKRLHELATEAKKTPGRTGDDDFVRIRVGIDGPFGAPAQRFYTYDKAIIVGAGIGVTPFSAILTDLEENFRSKGDPWQLTRTRSFVGRRAKRTLSRRSSASSLTPVNTQTHLDAEAEQGQKKGGSAANAAGEGLSAGPTAGQDVVRHGKQKEERYPGAEETKEERKTRLTVQGMRKSRPGSHNVRRVDFHWSVREKNDLLWFSDLLNRAYALAAADMGEHLTLNVHAHVTAKKKTISTHVFRYLLDSYRTKEHPESALTGLRASSHFGRPDFPAILNEFYNDMKQQGWHGRVGVFFCGPPVIGEVLADCCEELTARAKHEGYGMRFIMQIEVFN